MSYTKSHQGAWPISLFDPALPLDAHLGQAPGGFVWWYVDHVDAHGDGLVLIWSFGLPFLPGYLAAARRDQAELPLSRPSLNLVLYEGGRPSFYLLQEYAEEDAEWQGEAWRFGDSRIWLHTHEAGRELVAQLDCPLAGQAGRLQGELRVRGRAVHFGELPAAPTEASHHWSPVIGPAHLEAHFDIAGAAHHRQGPAYHDRNGGGAPLDRLGIGQWTWGRWVGPAGTQIYYVLWPEAPDAPPTAWGVCIDPSGQAVLLPKLQVEVGSRQRARYGMPHHPDLHLSHEGQPWLQIRTERIVDDGPFYLRTLVRRAEDGQLGFGEWVRPERIDRDWQRPFVRMRVHNTRGANSMWLPLFSGARQGRLRRLFGAQGGLP